MPVRLKGIDQVQSKFAQLSRDFHSFPKGNQENPLKEWETAYGRRGLKRKRPTVAKAGQYRGNRWPGLKIQYKRKTDGVVVPVWGGVKRLRKGTVTRATGKGIRVKASGPAVVKKGQTFSGRNVLGKLKSDGHRYKRGDKQRRANNQQQHQCFPYKIYRFACFHIFFRLPQHRRSRYPKLLINVPTTRLQPSERTNSSSLNGNEINIGGSINIPIEIITLAMTMSRIKNGK